MLTHTPFSGLIFISSYSSAPIHLSLHKKLFSWKASRLFQGLRLGDAGEENTPSHWQSCSKASIISAGIECSRWFLTLFVQEMFKWAGFLFSPAQLFLENVTVGWGDKGGREDESTPPPPSWLLHLIPFWNPLKTAALCRVLMRLFGDTFQEVRRCIFIRNDSFSKNTRLQSSKIFNSVSLSKSGKKKKKNKNSNTMSLKHFRYFTNFKSN